MAGFDTKEAAEAVAAQVKQKYPTVTVRVHKIRRSPKFAASIDGLETKTVTIRTRTVAALYLEGEDNGSAT